MKHSAEERETALMLSCGIGLCALIATLIIGRALERRKIHQLPLSGVGVLLGALSAGALRWVAPLSSSHVDDDVLRDERFDYDIFMVALLPPIIFEAGFNMDAPSCIRNIGPTVFFAFAGTTFSTVVVGGLCYTAGQLGWCYPLGMLASFTFGSLISATDPVSVLSVFHAVCTDAGVLNTALALARAQA